MEADPVELRKQVLAEALLEQIDPTLEEILRRGLVFELPVPRDALAAVCEEIPNLQQQINRAVALGLLEVSPDESLRVPRILPLKLPENATTLNRQAACSLYKTWCMKARTTTEVQLTEIHRLALIGNEKFLAIEVPQMLIEQLHQLAKIKGKQGESDEVVKLQRRSLEVIQNLNEFTNRNYNF